MVLGWQNAHHIAVVHMPSSGGTEFAIIGPEGIQGHAFVPMSWPKFQLGLNDNGTTLVSVSKELKRDSDSTSTVPVRIYHDNELVFESQKGLSSVVDPNGSFFAVHEVDADSQSRLVVGDLQTHEQYTVDLPSALSRSNWGNLTYRLRKSLSQREVMLTFSPQEKRPYDFWFFDLDEAELKKVALSETRFSFLTSSSNGYFLDPIYDSRDRNKSTTWRVVRAQLNDLNRDRHVLWSREIDVGPYSPMISISADGKWLTVFGRTIYVLNTELGNTAFRIPRFVDEQVRATRLPNLTTEIPNTEVTESVYRVQMFQDTMLVTRVAGSPSSCDAIWKDPKTRATYPDCLEELKRQGRYRATIDTFDLNTVYPDSLPTYSKVWTSEGFCSLRTEPFSGLEVFDGELAYRPFSQSEL